MHDVIYGRPLTATKVKQSLTCRIDGPDGQDIDDLIGVVEVGDEGVVLECGRGVPPASQLTHVNLRHGGVVGNEPDLVHLGQGTLC